MKKEINCLRRVPTLSYVKDAIEDAVVQHYKSLFSDNNKQSNSLVMSNYLNDLPKLWDVNRTRTDTPIERAEIEEAIDFLSIQTFLGPDSISEKFYECFKRIISPFVFKVITHADRVHMLPPFFSKRMPL